MRVESSLDLQASHLERTDRIYVILTLIIGLVGYTAVLIYHSIADGDLWARLAVGGVLINQGNILGKDIFAFTEILPQWIDHEWGAGVIFYWLLDQLGPVSLMLLKVLAACGTIIVSLFPGRLKGTRWQALLLLVLPCSITILPGYVTVVRSHAFTFLFFSFTLLCLELVRLRGLRFGIPIVFTMLMWANVHGGFLVGIFTIGIYTGAAVVTKERASEFLLIFGGALGVTLINPYGIDLWLYLIPAVLHPRSAITEWGAMSVFTLDPYFGFRILFVIVILTLLFGRRAYHNQSVSTRLISTLMLFFTAWAAWQHKRHAPFFGIAAAVYVGTYLDNIMDRMSKNLSIRSRWAFTLNPNFLILIVYAIATSYACIRFLPFGSFHPRTPASFYPVRAVEILRHSELSGNLVVPFRWGSFALWSLFPNIKVSIDGRYEETYPDSTFEINHDFFYKRGPTWDQLLKRYTVDFIIVDLKLTNLSLDDLRKNLFDIVWRDESSVLLAKADTLETLRAISASLPFAFSDLLDPEIPKKW